MNKYVALYIFGAGALICASLYEIREAYKEGLKDGKKLGRINGITEVIGTIHNKWSVLRETDNKDPLEWLDAVVKTSEEFTEDVTEKKEEKVDPNEEAKKEFMKAAMAAQERLMTS